MNTEDYTKNCLKTWSNIGDSIEHCAYGLVTESSEILDAFKKHKFYGRELNIQNLKEECGDLMWYLYQFLEELDYSPEDCRRDNIWKLLKRYPNKFEDVINRDVNNELNHIEVMEAANSAEERLVKLVKQILEDM